MKKREGVRVAVGVDQGEHRASITGGLQWCIAKSFELHHGGRGGRSNESEGEINQDWDQDGEREREREQRVWHVRGEGWAQWLLRDRTISIVNRFGLVGQNYQVQGGLANIEQDCCSWWAKIVRVILWKTIDMEQAELLFNKTPWSIISKCEIYLHDENDLRETF